MNFDYLRSIIALYLDNEDEKKKTRLNIVKENDKISFCFRMISDSPDKTFFNISSDIMNDNWKTFIELYKKDLMIIDEKYEFHQEDNTCYYYVKFKNGRTCSFDHFPLLEINNLRNYLFDIQINQEEIRVGQKEEYHYTPKMQLQYAGFISYRAIVLAGCIFLGAIITSLLVFGLLVS